jgi:alpha-tubulin suppressor-like RCC1 family protein
VRRDAGRDAGFDAGVDAGPELRVFAGSHHACATRSGSVSCWGFNDHGQLGDGTGFNRATPVAVVGLDDVVEVTAGWDHTCARRASGAVDCWGSNFVGELGDGTTTDRLRPVPVRGLTDAIELASGQSYTCALRGSGVVVCWGGYTTNGGSGAGIYVQHEVPEPIGGLSDAVEIAGGWNYACARRAGGTVACWGGPSPGTTGGEAWTAVPVVGLEAAVEIAGGGSRMCARLVTAQIACWGEPAAGVSLLGPELLGTLGDAAQIVLGHAHSCAVHATGPLSCWGGNEYGQLGDGSLTDRAVPVAALGLGSVIDAAAGVAFTCAVNDDDVFCFGMNTNGQLGDGTTTNRAVPVRVAFP